MWKEKFHWKKRLVFESLDWRNHHFVEYHCFFYYYYSYLELIVLRKRPYRTKGSLKLTTSSVSGGKGVHWMRVDLKTNTFKSKIQLVSVFKKVKLWFIGGASESGRSISTFLKPFHVINWKWVETNILVHWGESFINIPNIKKNVRLYKSKLSWFYLCTGVCIPVIYKKRSDVILIFRLLTLLTMESILLDIKDLIYGQKLDMKLKGSSNIESFKKKIRKKDLTSLLNNSNSCRNL